MTTAPSEPHPLRSASHALEVRIKSAPERVWDALTQDIGRWWPGEFYCGAGREGAAPTLLLEARPGGRMWEDWGGGDGLLWANVVQAVAGRCLDLVGTVGAAWGGPHTWFGSFELEGLDGTGGGPAADGGTRLRFSESVFGCLSDGAMEEKSKGWRFLLDGLRCHIEGRAAPKWSSFE